MQKLKRRAAALLAALVLVLPLTGCSEELYSELLNYEENTSESVSSAAEAAASLEGKQGPYEVVKIVDGDTIKLLIDGKNTNVRLIGIDTPESVHPDSDRNVPEGKLASDHTKELVGDSELYIEYGTEPQDRYGRPLCYVYLPDGTMLNEKIISDGYAKVLIVGKNKEYKDRFNELQEEAKAEGRGLWSTGVFDTDSDKTSSKSSSKTSSKTKK